MEVKQRISRWLEKTNDVLTGDTAQQRALDTLGISHEDLHILRMMQVWGVKAFSLRQLGITQTEVDGILSKGISSAPSRERKSSLRSFIAEAYSKYAVIVKEISKYSKQKCVEEMKSLLAQEEVNIGKLVVMAFMYYRNKGEGSGKNKSRPG